MAVARGPLANGGEVLSTVARADRRRPAATLDRAAGTDERLEGFAQDLGVVARQIDLVFGAVDRELDRLSFAVLNRRSSRSSTSVVMTFCAIGYSIIVRGMRKA